jgi:hypothetical protein
METTFVNGFYGNIEMINCYTCENFTVLDLYAQDTIFSGAIILRFVNGEVKMMNLYYRNITD